MPGASDDNSCTPQCVKDLGGNFVLVINDKDDVYRLDDQTLAESLAPEEVKVTATVESNSHTPHVLKIKQDQ